MLLEDATGGNDFSRKINHHKHHEILNKIGSIQIHYIVYSYLFFFTISYNLWGNPILSIKDQMSHGRYETHVKKLAYLGNTPENLAHLGDIRGNLRLTKKKEGGR